MSAQSTVLMVSESRIRNPPIVGVPAFFKWVSGTSSRILDTLPCWLFNQLIIVGPRIKLIVSAVMIAPPVRKVRYRNRFKN